MPASPSPPPPPPPPRPRSGSGSTSPGLTPAAAPLNALQSDLTTRRYFAHSSAQRTNSDAVIVETLRYQYPELAAVVAPSQNADLLGFAAAGLATCTLVEDGPPSRYPETLRWTAYVPPARRLDGDGAGRLAESLQWGKFAYEWNGAHFIVYLAEGAQGAYMNFRNFYILSPRRESAEGLVLAAGKWTNELHDEIWVYDGGYWQKSRELYESVKKASWDDVILDEDMKKSLIQDHMTFFRSRESYARLKVPWKRGVIYYGPPGNGKTISIKAMMNMLMKEQRSIPTLYVRSLVSVS